MISKTINSQTREKETRLSNNGYNQSDFWNDKYSKNIERDQIKIKEIENNGWKFITIWQCEIKNNLNKCVQKIYALLKH